MCSASAPSPQPMTIAVWPAPFSRCGDVHSVRSGWDGSGSTGTSMRPATPAAYSSSNQPVGSPAASEREARRRSSCSPRSPLSASGTLKPSRRGLAGGRVDRLPLLVACWSLRTGLDRLLYLGRSGLHAERGEHPGSACLLPRAGLLIGRGALTTRSNPARPPSRSRSISWASSASASGPGRSIGNNPSHRIARRTGRRCGQTAAAHTGIRGCCSGRGSNSPSQNCARRARP